VLSHIKIGFWNNINRFNSATWNEPLYDEETNEAYKKAVQSPMNKRATEGHQQKVDADNLINK
jgi:hypothetical protein